MNAIEKKHYPFSYDGGDRESAQVHATITKDVAVGFGEWLLGNYIMADGGYVKYDFEKLSPAWDKVYATSELYDIYVKSLDT